MANYSFLSMLKKYVTASMLLVVAAVAALICANTPLKEWYFDVWQNTVSISVGEYNFFSHTTSQTHTDIFQQ